MDLVHEIHHQQNRSYCHEESVHQKMFVCVHADGAGCCGKGQCCVDFSQMFFGFFGDVLHVEDFAPVAVPAFARATAEAPAIIASVAA